MRRTVHGARIVNAPDRSAWLAERRTGIGGSDIAAILGVSPYRTAVDVWMDKTGRAEPQPESEAMYWGNVLEDVVAREYSLRTGIKVERIKRIVRKPGADWMIANLDRICWQDGRQPVLRKTGEIRSRHALECKTANAFKSDVWNRADDLGDEPLPVEYTAQVMWYMGVCDLDIVDVAVLIGGQKYAQRRVERDDETIRGMFERAEDFWFSHVVADVAPPPVTANDAKALFPRDDGQSIEADDAMLADIGRAHSLKKEIQSMADDLEKITVSLKARIGKNAQVITQGGVPLATWKSNRDSVQIDWQAAYLDLNPPPEHIAKFKATTPGARPFKLK